MIPTVPLRQVRPNSRRVSLTALKREIVLNLIDKIIAKHNLNLKEITEIKVNNGPGSFTGLRAGISIANALGYSLNIPVNGKRQIASPRYK